MTEPAQTSTPSAETAPDATPPAGGNEGATAPVETPATPEADPKESFLGGTEEKPTEPTDKPKGEQSVDPGEFKLILPEGVEVDEAMTAEFSDIAKAEGISGEAASKVAGWFFERQAKELAAQTETLEAQDAKWVKELTADPDFGGDKVEATKREAIKGLRLYGGQAAVDDIVKLGLTNLPSLVRAFARAGRAAAEDTSTAGGPGSEGPKTKQTEQERLRAEYPSMYNEDGTPKVGSL